MMGTSMAEAVQELKCEDGDLSDKAVDDVIDALNKERTLTDCEVQYFRVLANAFRWNHAGNTKEAMPKGPLTMLSDVYSVHKTFKFGHL